jgi:hypothetical protein
LSFGQHFQDLQGVFPFRPCCCWLYSSKDALTVHRALS